MAAKVCPICRINKSLSDIVCKKCKVEAQKNGFSVRRGYLAYGQNETYKIRFENVKKKVFILWEEMRDEIDIFGDGEPQDVSWKDEILKGDEK